MRAAPLKPKPGLSGPPAEEPGRMGHSPLPSATSARSPNPLCPRSCTSALDASVPCASVRSAPIREAPRRQTRRDDVAYSSCRDPPQDVRSILPVRVCANYLQDFGHHVIHGTLRRHPLLRAGERRQSSVQRRSHRVEQFVEILLWHRAVTNGSVDGTNELESVSLDRPRRLEHSEGRHDILRFEPCDEVGAQARPVPNGL